MSDGVDTLVGDEQLADRPVALDELEDAVGQVPLEHLGECGPDQRAALGGLVDDGVAGGQGGGEQAGGGRQRIVPGRDHGHDAARLTADDVQGEGVAAEGAARVEWSDRRRLLHQRGRDLDGRTCVREQPAGVAHVEVGEAFGVGPHVGGRGAQGGGAAPGSGAAPAGEGGAGSCDGGGDLVDCGIRHTAGLCAGGGVDGHDP